MWQFQPCAVLHFDRSIWFCLCQQSPQYGTSEHKGKYCLNQIYAFSHLIFYVFIQNTRTKCPVSFLCPLPLPIYTHAHTRAHSKPWRCPDDKLQLFPELFIDLLIYFQGKEIKHQDQLFWNCTSFSKVIHIALQLQALMSREKLWQMAIARFFMFLPCQTFLIAEVAVLSSAEYAIFWMEIEPPFF